MIAAILNAEKSGHIIVMYTVYHKRYTVYNFYVSSVSVMLLHSVARCIEFQVKNSIVESEIFLSAIVAQNRVFRLLDPKLDFRVILGRKTTKRRISLPVAPIGNLRADLDTSKTSILGSFWGVLVSPSRANEKA